MKNNNKKTLLTREDKIKNLKETFTYDNLNRLKSSQVGGQDAINLSYNKNSGNIISKSDVGGDDYKYKYGENGAGLHAVTSISESSNNNAFQGLRTSILSQQNITYTSFNKIATVTQGENEMQFTYGTDNLRRKTQLYNNGELIKTKYYVGSYEKEITGSSTRELHYISGGDGLAAVLEKKGTSKTMYYVSKDYLGSPIMLTKEDGTIAEQYNFDAWGNRRNPSNWSYTDVPTSYLLDRGFTFHEHMDEFGLINMNGRLYDPKIARMLSPDNYVPAPDFTQNFNRYSYCLNNPLKYTDPSGNNYVSDMYHGNNGGGSYMIGFGSPNLSRHMGDHLNFLSYNDYPSGSTYVTDGKGNGALVDSKDYLTGNAVAEYLASEYDITFYVPVYGWTDIGCLGYHTRKYEFLRFQTVDVATNGGDESWLSKAWNSDIARLYLPDVVYVNGSGVLAYLGGGGTDVGLALPLRGQDAGKVYLYGTLKGKAGLHGGVSVNMGRSNYLGPVDLFDFDATFKGLSVGIEGDYIFGASVSASEYDQYGNTLLSIDIGVGPGIGGSFNISAVTDATFLFRLW